jgi:hypothetical protein
MEPDVRQVLLVVSHRRSQAPSILYSANQKKTGDLCLARCDRRCMSYSRRSCALPHYHTQKLGNANRSVIPSPNPSPRTTSTRVRTLLKYTSSIRVSFSTPRLLLLSQCDSVTWRPSWCLPGADLEFSSHHISVQPNKERLRASQEVCISSLWITYCCCSMSTILISRGVGKWPMRAERMGRRLQSLLHNGL